jgi:hypothetical protein
MSARKPLRVDCDRPFADVLALVRAGLRAIARPGGTDATGGDLPAELLAWCDDESEEGLDLVERGIACRHLKCAAVALVEAEVHCAGDAGGGQGAIGGGVVKCKAWIPSEENRQ